MEVLHKEKTAQSYGQTAINYQRDSGTFLNHVTAFFIGALAGMGIMFIFYKIFILTIFGGVLVGGINVFLASQRRVAKRKRALRLQFYDFLEAMSVAMRAGKPPLKAMESSIEDLSLLYPNTADIMVELRVAVGKFNNAVPLSEVYSDLAKRSGLEDIDSFASIYATIEGKSSRADQIVRDTQEIIADKMRIEMEIETLMTAAKNEVNIMLLMPLVVLGLLGYSGGGFMDSIYTTPLGRIVATGGLIVFFISFFMAQKFASIEL